MTWGNYENTVASENEYTQISISKMLTWFFSNYDQAKRTKSTKTTFRNLYGLSGLHKENKTNVGEVKGNVQMVTFTLP